MPEQRRSFVVEIEAPVWQADRAKLSVHAFDEDSARKKFEKAFARGRVLGVDVNAGAGVWANAVVSQEDTSGT